MPSKLDPHLVAIEGWLATEPQLTALAIVRRPAAIDPARASPDTTQWQPISPLSIITSGNIRS
jgi:hypothetical protein